MSSPLGKDAHSTKTTSPDPRTVLDVVSTSLTNRRQSRGQQVYDEQNPHAYELRLIIPEKGTAVSPGPPPSLVEVGDQSRASSISPTTQLRHAAGLWSEGHQASEDQMSRQKRRANFSKPDQPGSTDSSARDANGLSLEAMNSHVELRRKGHSVDSPTSASQTENLIHRESFTLDDAPPDAPGQPSHGFWELPVTDRKNFMLLVLLYFLQGIPMGLASGSVPFLLKPFLSYSQIGIFSLAAYPYSLKLLWSPIVDAVWSPKLGRRKSWILPIQMLSGLGMIWLGGKIGPMLEKLGTNHGASVWNFTGWWFFLVFMCATQDIAVDGRL